MCRVSWFILQDFDLPKISPIFALLILYLIEMERFVNFVSIVLPFDSAINVYMEKEPHFENHEKIIQFFVQGRYGKDTQSDKFHVKF